MTAVIPSEPAPELEVPPEAPTPVAGELLQDSPAARPCVHRRVHHEHGDLQRYKQDRCRCVECCAASLNYDRARLQTIAYGRWAPFVDADPVRNHVYELLWAKDLKTIARESGISRATIRCLLFGNRKRGTPPSRRIRASTANALKALSAGKRTAADPAELWEGNR